MGRLALKAMLGAALTVFCAAASCADVTVFRLNNFGSFEIGPGCAFAYESVAISPGYDPKTGITYTEWHYDYFLENLSTTLTITAWTCAQPTVDQILQALPPLGPVVDLNPKWGQNSLDDPAGPVALTSTITWSDGHTTQADIYAIPEPGGMVAWATGVIGLLGFIRRRRMLLHAHAAAGVRDSGHSR